MMIQGRGGGLARLLRLILLGVGAALVLLGLALVGDLVRFLPAWLRNHSIEWTFAAIAAGYLLSGSWVRRPGLDVGSAGRLARGLERVDAVSRGALRRGLFLGLAGTAGVWLAIWIPHYLSWPWCRDVDTFAVIAMAWDAGQLPYRDIRGYNFPGHIYLHWILGKLFGWGRVGVFYGVDAAALLALGGVVLAWSRRCFRNLLPGMAAYLIFLGYYLDRNFELVAQRDWHTALGATLSILTLETWPGRRGRWLSAFLAAMAFTIRPHLVLFLPALAYTAMRSEGASDGELDSGERIPWSRRGALSVLEWTCAFALFATAGFAPLLFAGVLDDLVRGLRVASYGGPYSTFTTARGAAILLDEIQEPRMAALLVALACLSFGSSRGTLKAHARTWLLALVGALVYRPLHPVDHGYLRTPLALVSAIAWAIPFSWCIQIATEKPGMLRRPLLGVLTILLLLYETIPSMPRFVPDECSVQASFNAIHAAASSTWPELPPGAWGWYHHTKQPYYTWDGYNRLLRYVRETTGPETIVANVLKNPPFPSVNGPTGRRSPFTAESGIAWMWLVHEDLDEKFARELEQAGADSIVVWSPTEINSQPRLPLKRLTEVIRNEYEPEARFELVEVWRRKSRTSAKVPVSRKAE